MCRPAHVLLDLMIFFLLFYFFTSRVETPPWEEVLLGCEPATAVNANTDTPLCEMKRQTHNLINEKMMWTLVWRQRTLKNEQVNGMMAHPWCLNKSAHTPWCMVVQCYAYAMTHEHLCLVLFSKARLLKYIWIIRHRNFKCFFFVVFFAIFGAKQQFSPLMSVSRVSLKLRSYPAWAQQQCLSQKQQ